MYICTDIKNIIDDFLHSTLDQNREKYKDVMDELLAYEDGDKKYYYDHRVPLQKFDEVVDIMRILFNRTDIISPSNIIYHGKYKDVMDHLLFNHALLCGEGRKYYHGKLTSMQQFDRVVGMMHKIFKRFDIIKPSTMLYHENRIWDSNSFMAGWMSPPSRIDWSTIHRYKVIIDYVY